MLDPVINPYKIDKNPAKIVKYNIVSTEVFINSLIKCFNYLVKCAHYKNKHKRQYLTFLEFMKITFVILWF